MSAKAVQDAIRHEIQGMLEEMARGVAHDGATEGRMAVAGGQFSSADVIEALDALAAELCALDVIA